MHAKHFILIFESLDMEMDSGLLSFCPHKYFYLVRVWIASYVNYMTPLYIQCTHSRVCLLLNVEMLSNFPG